MPTSLPVARSRTQISGRQTSARRAWLGWAWSDWALFLAAYGVVICAVLFSAPAEKAPRSEPAVVSQQSVR